MTRGAALLAGVTGLSVALTAVGAVLIVVNWPLPVEVGEWGFPGFQGIAALAFTIVGAAVAARRRRNPIGWLLLVAAFFSALQFAGHQYAILGLVRNPGSVPAPSLGTWLEEWVWLPILAAVGVYVMLLFPTGRLLSPRWRLVAVVGTAGALAGSVGTALLPLVRVPGAVNPFAAGGPPPGAEPLAYSGMLSVAGAVLVACISVRVRFVRATGVERQQLKWLALGALLVGVVLSVYTASVLLSGDPYHPLAGVAAVSVMAIPVTIALAILRYGLYEVDRLINRTVVYGAVSVVLLALYATSVLVLQPLLGMVTGGSTIAVAASTLLVATIFQPVRRRVQATIDHRFFRSRYDAQVAAERLTGRLREEVDLDTLAGALLDEVSRAMQPARAIVWLRRR
jgi:hypothetical protein